MVWRWVLRRLSNKSSLEGSVESLRVAVSPLNDLRGMLQTLAGAGSQPGASEEAAR